MYLIDWTSSELCMSHEAHAACAFYARIRAALNEAKGRTDQKIDSGM